MLTTAKRKNPNHHGFDGRASKRTKLRDARTILAQPADAAYSQGTINLQAFMKTREVEIRALEDAMQRSTSVLSSRAFQKVPRSLRRRTASHNVKRVPRRLQSRARREMKEDNTPTVDPCKRKPRSTRARLRAETAKRLGMLARKKARKKEQQQEHGQATSNETASVTGRRARPKNVLSAPPQVKSKFRKRQIDKTWLPTHMWHAKRARMTEPKNPLWRFAIPLTSTEKSYRPTHRASGASGAVIWDMSYMSTIGLHGKQEGIVAVLEHLGMSSASSMSGKRAWYGELRRSDNGKIIGPAMVVWASTNQQSWIRIQPAAFLETWTETLRLAKSQKPALSVEDLRYEVGSIELKGPGSMEALLGVLTPSDLDDHGKTFPSLNGVTNPASLPRDVLLTFSIQDPRLRYPPRPSRSTYDEVALLQLLSTWPVDGTAPSTGIFDHDLRVKASRLPSQKAINRRKSLVPPGSYPAVVPSDPAIPVMLLNTRMGSWVLLAPWKTILPIWYGLMHWPLSTGGNPRFGGLDEWRQVHFEHGIPWFPADFPGTTAGAGWESDQRIKRKRDWEKRPKGKRIQWESLGLGSTTKGEHGSGWSCDWELIMPSKEDITDDPLLRLSHLQTSKFRALLRKSEAGLDPCAVATIRITLLGRGVVTECARIYNLPRSTLELASSDTSAMDLRQRYLNQRPSRGNGKALPKQLPAEQLRRLPLNAPLPQRMRLLAQSLLQQPPLPYPPVAREDDHPACPGVENLMGFVTTGAFNLSEGKGTAIGTVLVSRCLEAWVNDPPDERGYCVVRNAGETVARLAKWEPV